MGKEADVWYKEKTSTMINIVVVRPGHTREKGVWVHSIPVKGDILKLDGIKWIVDTVLRDFDYTHNDDENQLDCEFVSVNVVLY